MSVDIFRHADKSLMVMLNDMSREFQRLGTQIGFDELNVLETRKTVNAMYKRMDAVVQREYRKIALSAYKEAGGRGKGFDPYEFVYAMLEAYDPLSEFVYTREWTRKRDRLFESIIATQTGNQEMRKNLKRGLDVLANQVRQYADNATIQARVQAFKDSGIEYVRWVTEDDEKVCKVCDPRHGVVYKLDEIEGILPAHWRCRCHIEKATEEDYLAQQAA